MKPTAFLFNTELQINIMVNTEHDPGSLMEKNIKVNNNKKKLFGG